MQQSIVLFFLLLFCSFAFSQNLFLVETDSCEIGEYFDISRLQCQSCGETNKRKSNDGFGCVCEKDAKLANDNGSPSKVKCETCSSGETSTQDGWDCIKCDGTTATYNPSTKSCSSCSMNSLPIGRSPTGSLRAGYSCEPCVSGTSSNGNKCVPCRPIEGETTSCQCDVFRDGSCFIQRQLIPENVAFIPQIGGFGSLLFSQLFRTSAAQCEIYSNLTACQVLGNLCVLSRYNKDRSNGGGGAEKDACSEYLRIQSDSLDNGVFPGWPENMPWLYYEEKAADTLLKSETMERRYSFENSQEKPNSLEFVVAIYSMNGSLIEFGPLSGQLQLCSDRIATLQSAYEIGTAYENNCQYTVSLTTELKFYDVYLKDGENGELFPVPVLNENYQLNNEAVNLNTDQSSWQLTRRFFLIDTQSGITSTNQNPTTITVADKIKIDVKLTSNSGQIHPPLITIHYKQVEVTDGAPTTLPVSFSVVYSMNTSSFSTGLTIAVSIMTGLAFLYSILQIHGWRRRASVDTLNFSTIVTFFFLFCGSLSSSFFWVMFGSGLYWLLFFKVQNDVSVLLPTSDQEQIFVVLLIVTLVLRCLRLLHLIWKQTHVDIFLIDWEKPRRSLEDAEGASQATVSIWRTYFVANEWNEIQTMRKISSIFQMVVALFFLQVIGFEDICRQNPHSYYSLSRDNFPAPFSRLLRFAMAASVLLGTALCQWIFFAFFYERFVEDKIRQFVDLCSVANISVFLLEESAFGYYIHGRSIHGRADTNMKEMNQQMAREMEDLCGKRGLVPDTDLQTFEIALTLKLRHHYDRIMLPVQDEITRRGQQGENEARQGHISPRTLQAYAAMNKFLSAFLDHALRDYDFIVRDKILLERLLGIEFNDPMDKAYLYNDDGHSFDHTLFYGNEMTLLLFDILVFSVTDLVATNYVLAVFVTYLVGLFVALLRESLGRRNLAKKTLVDQRFLI